MVISDHECLIEAGLVAFRAPLGYWYPCCICPRYVKGHPNTCAGHREHEDDKGKAWSRSTGQH